MTSKIKLWVGSDKAQHLTTVQNSCCDLVDEQFNGQIPQVPAQLPSNLSHSIKDLENTIFTNQDSTVDEMDVEEELTEMEFKLNDRLVMDSSLLKTKKCPATVRQYSSYLFRRK